MAPFLALPASVDKASMGIKTSRPGFRVREVLVSITIMFMEVQKEIATLRSIEMEIMREVRLHKKLLAAFKILAVLLTTAFPGGFASAMSFVSITDTISNSAPGETASHSIRLNNPVAFGVGDWLEVHTPSDMTVTAVACNQASTVVEQDADTHRCEFSASVATNTTIIVSLDVINPPTIGSYEISIQASHSQQAKIWFAVVDSVQMSASIQSTLQFSVAEVATDTPVNGVVTTAGSGTSSIAFGSLQIGTSSTIAQELSVITNAAAGFVVTVQQDQNLTSSNGSNISPFKDGAATWENWVAPAGLLNATSTYGHFGFTSDDISMNFGSGNNPFGGSIFTGFSSTTPVAVMYNDGPADGLTPSRGLAKVAYRVDVSPFQEAGDYYNTLTYVATPTY
jgi:hypothetical protein